jgi:hypothetical protein
MRSLNRNKRKIYYALRTGDTVNVDDYGNETGERTPTYGERIALKCNISAATGQEAVQAFGSFTGYSRTMFVADSACPIDEDSILWFGIEPTEPHNYIVVRKADSKNGILYALQEVTVTS